MTLLAREQLVRLLPAGRHLIAGDFVPAVDGDELDVIDPATGQCAYRVPRGRADDVDRAVRAAEDAFPAWRDLPPGERAARLRRWADLCLEHGNELACLESWEVGKPIAHSGAARTGVGNLIHFYAGLADKLTGRTLPTARPDLLAFTLREPFGVCGAIVPWNVPGMLVAREAAPALAAGNTMVVKPAEEAPVTALYIGRLALEAGIPPGVLNIVTGYGHEAGAALPVNPLIRHMAFTGSQETGTKVMQACAVRAVPVHLELGGKSPHILLADADLSRAIPMIVRQLLYNSGQICYAGTRLLVDQSRRSEVVAAVADLLRRTRIGAWYEDVDMGPLISAKQQERVLGYIATGQSEGARLVTGGNKLMAVPHRDGFFVEPALFDDVAPEMVIAQEEIFGPVLSVLAFSDPDDAIDIANHTRYGLAAAIWTTNIERAVKLARGVQAGHVYINGHGFQGVPSAPFGGYKQSGFGRTHGADSIEHYTQIKTVIIDASS